MVAVVVVVVGGVYDDDDDDDGDCVVVDINGDEDVLAWHRENRWEGRLHIIRRQSFLHFCLLRESHDFQTTIRLHLNGSSF